jgi:hypothetical protein
MSVAISLPSSPPKIIRIPVRLAQNKGELRPSGKPFPLLAEEEPVRKLMLHPLNAQRDTMNGK